MGAETGETLIFLTMDFADFTDFKETNPWNPWNPRNPWSKRSRVLISVHLSESSPSIFLRNSTLDGAAVFVSDARIPDHGVPSFSPNLETISGA